MSCREHNKKSLALQPIKSARDCFIMEQKIPVERESVASLAQSLY